MERKRMDQIQLAEALGVSRSAVNAWINDRAYPQNSIGALEDVLGVRLDEDNRNDGRARTISPELRRLILQTLDDVEDQRRVIGLLEGTLTWPEPAEPEAPERQQSAG
jgi:transcriptional regulator with XRE-family HTH domain